MNVCTITLHAEAERYGQSERGIMNVFVVWAHSFVDWLRHHGQSAVKDDESGVAEATGSSNDAPDCVLVLDTSTSMGCKDGKPSRLEAAKRASQAYAKRLAEKKPRARVAVVGYGSDALVYCYPTNVSQRQAVTLAISQIRTTSATNITAGLEAAQSLLRCSHGPCQVVLLSDGHHNTGPGPESVATHLKKNAVIECVGIGGSPSTVDEPLLKDIASPFPDGSKRYRWIGDSDQLVEHFEDLAGRITRA